MQESARKLCKKILMDALKQSGYNIMKWQIRHSAGGLFMSIDDVNRANQVAYVIFDGINGKAERGELEIPYNPAEIEFEVDLRLWDLSASDSIMWLNSFARNRSNKELLSEAREAINQLNKMGKRGEEKAYAHEWILKKKIGEV